MNSDLFSGVQAVPATPAGMPGSSPEFACSVLQLNLLVKDLLDALPAVWVQGEVAGWKRYPSGHCYFTLRDGDSQIRCVMWRTHALRLPTDPADGMQVRVFGAPSLYEKRGEFQFSVREMDGKVAGGLWRLAFDRLVAKLRAEGLLDPARKRAIPRVPNRVGIVTSPVGAALHDMLTVIGRRAPWTRVAFSPARVQGDGAGADIARAIGLLARCPAVDVIIVGRGGGSTEDLWAFNEEIVARAIAACPVPVISAVGHEVDTTIADLVADLRAPTPSAAAEHAVPDRAALERQIAAAHAALLGGLQGYVAEREVRLGALAERFERNARERVRAGSERLARNSGRLEALSPLGTLARGFAVPLDADGTVLRNAHDFAPGASFRLRVVDGNVDCRVAEGGTRVAPDA